MTMVIKVMPENLFKQPNMTWSHVVSKTIMCNVHVDLHIKYKYVVI
jgi:hypothetical protein